jgi:hypothetical protein
MQPREVIEVHTSDRQTYKRCRRRFGWQSPLRENLIRIGPDQKAFFLGTGFHFALEDFHGYRRFAHPALAFAAYYDAQKPSDMPDEADEALELATGMLMYYADDWIVEHPEPYETLVVDRKPQVEVEVAVDITGILYDAGVDRGWLDEVLDGKSVHYVTTYDRVVIDKHDRIYGLDYKTAASFDELNLQTNPQAGAYDWSMALFYGPVGYKPEGMVWQQHKKAFPVSPPLVYVGKKRESFSLKIDQPTTYRLYMKAINERYGALAKVPYPLIEDYTKMLAHLGNLQDENGDQYIRREVLRRNQYQREVEQGKIVDEVLEMLDPDLPLYPNPTKDCSWDCPFKAPCLAMDDGSDWESILETEYVQWAGYRDDWRSRVKYPDNQPAEPTLSFVS